MSAVALERQFWWRPNLPDLSSPLQPPAASPGPHSSPQPSLSFLPPHKLTFHTSFPACFPLQYIGPTQLALPHSSPLYTGILLPECNTKHQTPPHSPHLRGRHCLEAQLEPKPTAPTMHAQVTSGNLAVSIVEDVAAPKKASSESSCSDASHLLHTAAVSPVTDSSVSTASTKSCQCGESKATTISAGNCCADPLKDSSPPPPPQNSSCWGSKTLSNSNSNSRNNLTPKIKGGCCVRRRLMDDEGYIRRAACICVNKEETQVMLVTSKKDPCVWLVPGGGLEAGEDAVTAAQREAWEEAGIHGDVERFLGLFESCHHSGSKKHRTAVFVFVVTEEHKDFPEAGLGRRRRWFSLEDALVHLARHRPLQSAYLQLLMMSKLKVAAAS